MRINIKYLNQPYYIYCFILLALLIPFAKFISIAIILLSISIIFLQPLSQSLNNIKLRPLLWLFAASYLLYLIGMLYTSNMTTGLMNLEYKLSLLIFPLIIGACPKIRKENFYNILIAFVASCFMASIVCVISGTFFSGRSDIPVYTDLSLFLHPSYFSLYLNFCFVVLIYLFKRNNCPSLSQLFITFILVYLFIFNLYLSSKAGTILSFMVFSYFGIEYIRKKSKLLIVLFFGFMVGVVFLALNIVPGLKERFHHMKESITAAQISPEIDESSQIRILIWQQATEVIKENFFFGVGTGDGKDALMEKYEQNSITMALKDHLNAHNQYLELMVSFGVIGFFLWVMVWLCPFIYSFQNKNILHVSFIFLILISFSVESMLEAQAGVVFYAFFNSLLYFHVPVKISY